MNITDRKKRIQRLASDRLTIESELNLDRDLAGAKTHADLDRIENSLDSSEACADEEDLFDA